MTKGFITLAVGDHYCRLAEHLYMSYKLFSGCDHPFYVITDEAGKDRLSKTFDGVIVRSGFTNTSVDKICIFTDTPFDETIFIDADCSVVKSLENLFDMFEKNGSPVSGIGDHKDLPEGQKGVQFSENTAAKLNIHKDYPNFNGGVYYYNKTEDGVKCVDFMMKELYPNYHDYELRGRHNSTNMGDEPLVIVSMLYFGFRPIPVLSGVMTIVHDVKTVRWDMKRKTCSYRWYEHTVSPAIIHWSVGWTETLRYERYDADVRGLYYHQSALSAAAAKSKSFVKFKIYPKMLKIFPSLHNVAEKMKK